MDRRSGVTGLNVLGDRRRFADRDGETLVTLAEKAKLSEAAVSIPTTSPATLTSGPPESPASILALVSINPDSCSLPPLS